MWEKLSGSVCAALPGASATTCIENNDSDNAKADVNNLDIRIMLNAGGFAFIRWRIDPGCGFYRENKFFR
jgi:hypothetical protein